MAARQRRAQEKNVEPEAVEPPQWRPFQLAFLLMNLRAFTHPTHTDRELVDLLFFPTGGGKTEAYLGLAAFAIFLRRLRDPGVTSAGVTVLMRYTLRLLTLDQLGPAATLICAMEMVRRQNDAALGKWPFEVGLWVGKAATPNRMGKKGESDRTTAGSCGFHNLRTGHLAISPISVTSSNTEKGFGSGASVRNACRCCVPTRSSSRCPRSSKDSMKSSRNVLDLPRLIRPRLGQGTFRVAVTDACGRACAITHEHSLPALEAAHIRPYKHDGPHDVRNGLLLRADLHRLFDQGYLTVTPDLQLKVSGRLREDYDNGKTYYPLDKKALSEPATPSEHPCPEYLTWHNEHVFRG